MSTTSNLSTVTRIGAGVRLTESATSDIVATLPAGFDPAVSGAVTGAIHLWAVGCSCPSGRGKSCQCGARPDVKRGGKSTDYGRGVDALTKSVTRALTAGDDKPVTLRATLSGEGGGSCTIAPDHALYAAVVALIRDGQES
jgi:hypothetical protein